MTDAHCENFMAVVQMGVELHAPIDVGNVSVTILQLSNVAWQVNP